MDAESQTLAQYISTHTMLNQKQLTIQNDQHMSTSMSEFWQEQKYYSYIILNGKLQTSGLRYTKIHRYQS